MKILINLNTSSKKKPRICGVVFKLFGNHIPLGTNYNFTQRRKGCKKLLSQSSLFFCLI